MSYIQFLGNGRGYIYAALPDGTKTIAYVEPNTTQGVRNMRVAGAASAPIVAARSSIGTVTFTGVAAGNITAITINAVNQLAAPVAADPVSVIQTATDVAAAINSFAPAGFTFTAEAINGVVNIYSTPDDGVAVNGLTISVTVSNAGITTTTTAFTGGSSQTGVYDTSVGLTFYLDPSITATRTAIALTAEDISSYIVVRGLQSGIFTESLSVTSTAKLLNIVRCSAFTNIKTDTASAVPASDLTFIDTNGFVEGDVVRITQEDPARIVTVYDVSNAQQFPANIYLTNADPFSCTNNKSLELRYQYDNTLGPIWIENGRSFVPGPNILTRAQLLALISTNDVQIGETYLVSDATNFTYEGIDGVLLTGLATDLVSTSGQAIFYLPDYQNNSNDFGGTWNSQIPSVTILKLYAWNGAMFVSLTGNVGTDPSTDAVNWLKWPTSNPEYVREVHSVEYNLSANTLVKRADKRGNVVTGAASCNSFRWGDDSVAANTVQGSNIKCWNIAGGITNNVMINSEFVATNIYQQTYSANTWSNVRVMSTPNGSNGPITVSANNLTNCEFYFKAINNLNFTGNNGINSTFEFDGSQVTPTQPWVISNNIINDYSLYARITTGTVSSHKLTFRDNFLTGNNVNATAKLNLLLESNVANAELFFSGNTVSGYTVISFYSNLVDPLLPLTSTVRQNTITGVWRDDFEFQLNGLSASGNVLQSLSQSNTFFINLQQSMYNEIVSNTISSYQYECSFTNDVVGTTFTLPVFALGAGVIRLQGTGTITKILPPAGYEFPLQAIKIIPGVTSVVTITPAPIASVVAAGEITSDGGTVTLNTYYPFGPSGTEVYDSYTIQSNYNQEYYTIPSLANIWIKQTATIIQ
jgi:hypothetical protein